MWSDAGREDGLWSDAEWATDILKRSHRPLLSSFFSFPLSLPHATTCLYPPSNRSISLQPFSSCPCPASATATRRSCLCPASAAAARHSCLCPVLGHRRTPTLVLVLPQPPPRAALVCVLSSAATARRLLSLTPSLSLSCFPVGSLA